MALKGEETIMKDFNLRNNIYLSNLLINARKIFDLMGMRIFLLGLRGVNPHISSKDKFFDSEFQTLFISTSELTQLFGNTKYLNELKGACDKLFNTTVNINDTINNTKKGFLLTHIFQRLEYVPYKGLYLKFDEQMRPYLLDLIEANGFTQIRAEYLFKLSSPYAIRLLELLVQYQNIRHFKELKEIYRKFTLEELRFMLNVPENAYNKRIDNFKRYVLNVAIGEINTRTPYKIKYSVVKTGRRVTGFEFAMDTSDVPVNLGERPKYSEDAITALIKLGFTEKAANAIYSKCENTADCFARINRAKLVLSRQKKVVFNKLGFLRKAIENNWQITHSESYMNKKSPSSSDDYRKKSESSSSYDKTYDSSESSSSYDKTYDSSESSSSYKDTSFSDTSSFTSKSKKKSNSGFTSIGDILKDFLPPSLKTNSEKKPSSSSTSILDDPRRPRLKISYLLALNDILIASIPIVTKKTHLSGQEMCVELVNIIDNFSNIYKSGFYRKMDNITTYDSLFGLFRDIKENIEREFHLSNFPSRIKIFKTTLKVIYYAEQALLPFAKELMKGYVVIEKEIYLPPEYEYETLKTTAEYTTNPSDSLQPPEKYAETGHNQRILEESWEEMCAIKAMFEETETQAMLANELENLFSSSEKKKKEDSTKSRGQVMVEAILDLAVETINESLIPKNPKETVAHLNSLLAKISVMPSLDSLIERNINLTRKLENFNGETLNYKIIILATRIMVNSGDTKNGALLKLLWNTYKLTYEDILKMYRKEILNKLLRKQVPKSEYEKITLKNMDKYLP